jgi:hypothetical protein
MNLLEASKFYGSYQALFDELRVELSENVSPMIVPEKIEKYSLVFDGQTLYNDLSDRKTAREI